MARGFMMQRQRGFHFTSWNIAKALRYFSFNIFFMQNLNSKLSSTQNLQFSHLMDWGFQTTSANHILPKYTPFNKCSKSTLSLLYPLLWQHSASYQQPNTLTVFRIEIFNFFNFILGALNTISPMQYMPNFKKMHIYFKLFLIIFVFFACCNQYQDLLQTKQKNREFPWDPVSWRALNTSCIEKCNRPWIKWILRKQQVGECCKGEGYFIAPAETKWKCCIIGVLTFLTES